jgi:primary-amine oxidase
MAKPNSWWRKRAKFVDYHVWVTPYDDNEKYAAGEYPNQSKGMAIYSQCCNLFL